MSPALIHGSVDRWLAQRTACGELVDAWHKVAVEYGAGHPAALGILLALVREAWGCDEWRRLTVEPAGKGWGIVVRNARHRPPSRAQGGWDLDPSAHPRYMSVAGPFGANQFDSEAEALVAALEAAP